MSRTGPPSENGPESPFSLDEPSPKKSKRGVHKRVVSVPIRGGGGADVEGSNRSKGEPYPPSDSWAWRKYGQKPIKGSPYPRGYYGCSSSKGCPARKQVERSRVDPTTLIVTYVCDHNHPFPAKSHPAASAKSPAEDDVDEPSAAPAISGVAAGGESEGLTEWFGEDVASTAIVLLESPICCGADVEAEVSTAVSGEDDSLFADLGELPESAVVFRRRIAVPCCGSTG